VVAAGPVFAYPVVMVDGLTYKQAGVDIKEAAALVGDIGALRGRTEGRRKLHQAFGLFAAAYDLSAYREPVIVTGCDGVGTKLELCLRHDQLETAGKDLVAMNVNDILTTGGDPLLFLDYVGIGRLDKDKITRLIAGMAEWLAACDCILAGGETAEMPGIVPDGVVELAGFCVGAAEKSDLIDPAAVAVGDAVVGYASDGFHANGWSLVRRVLAANPAGFSDSEIISLLAPTRLYHDVTRDLRSAGLRPKAMAHITGGGLVENLERFLGNKGADLEIPFWDNPVIQKVLNHVDSHDRFDTFNMGIGWVVICAPGEVATALAAGPGGHQIGTISATQGVRVAVK
jgi:phosphoribosylformylglycinamidine cyclo-ligase